MQEKDGKQLELFEGHIQEASKKDLEIYDEIAAEVIAWRRYVARTDYERKNPVRSAKCLRC